MTDMGARLKAPPHPGGFIRRNVIEGHGLSVTAGAHVLGVSRPTLSQLLNERAALSPEMALRIEKAFGLSMETLMRMQTSFDVARARRKADEIVVDRFIAQEKAMPPASLR